MVVGRWSRPSTRTSYYRPSFRARERVRRGLSRQLTAFFTSAPILASSAVHRLVTLGAIAGLPRLAVGKALPLPAARIFGVGTIALSFVGLSVTSSAVARAARSAVTRHLLLVSAASVAAAVGLAGVYGVGELAGRDWIDVGRMVATQGLLMSLGFTLCGLVGHLRLRRG